MTTRSIGLDDRLYDYFSRIGFRQPAVLKKLAAETGQFDQALANMQTAPEQGAFLALMVQLTAARHILEIGTFTGYSSLAMALAHPEVEIVAVDISERFTSIARRYWQEAGVEGRIRLRLDGGLIALEDLLAQGKSGFFDLIFIDADKENYRFYYERGLELLRAGGLMLIDNTLWYGAVADPDDQTRDTLAIRQLNEAIAQDQRVEQCLVPLGDGLTMIRKIAQKS